MADAKPKTKPAAPDKACNNIEAVAFVHKYQSDAAHLAAAANVPVENILGLAASETGYGKGRFAREGNNFFSMHAPAPMQTGELPTQDNPKVKVATFDSFMQCGRSFLVRFGGFINGKTDPTDFAKALVAGRFNPGKAGAGGNDKFESDLVAVIGMVKRRMACGK